MRISPPEKFEIFPFVLQIYRFGIFSAARRGCDNSLKWLSGGGGGGQEAGGREREIEGWGVGNGDAQ